MYLWSAVCHTFYSCKSSAVVYLFICCCCGKQFHGSVYDTKRKVFSRYWAHKNAQFHIILHRHARSKEYVFEYILYI